MQRFVELLGITEHTRVLDVGGTPDIWALAPVRPRVVFLNESREEPPATVHGDGCRLPFRDAAFDVVFSNSVIEHVGDAARQRAFAAEAARVGKGYWVQTPNRRFPVEVHLHTPFIHWLPREWQRALVPRVAVWRWMVRTTPDRREFYLRHYLDTIRLLDAGQMQAMFPDSHILSGAKSIIAWRAIRT
ncbi:MAG TPA: methyltransferase domain-containing protein [Bryobacteraceae bacterium]|nr:methyltransferase domain-containing protein [Bryobacteraceae bacterium]